MSLDDLKSTHGAAGQAPAFVAGPAVPPLRPGQPPLAILVDYDGTIATQDVTDAILLPAAAGHPRQP
jgi:hypothetical protein